MKFYTEGTVVAVEKGSFNDQSTGQLVEFYKNFIQCDDESVVTLGSGKADFSKYKGKQVVCTVDARIPNGEKLYKLTIREMRDVRESDEETIV
ncbi:hypothetical protein H7X87_04025 [Acetobacteraceae bacterium]|nr:hypothetical protein [Candidatus Parcubacteria bacterium]